MCGPRSAADVGRNFSLQSRRDLSPEIERGKAILLQLVKSKTQICALGHMSRQLNELIADEQSWAVRTALCPVCAGDDYDSG